MTDLSTNPIETNRVAELSSGKLSHPCDPTSLGFASTDELPDLLKAIGQPRAIRAIELGSEITGSGYNVFVLGLPSSGRTTLTYEYLQRKAASEPIPEDWCYVNNFKKPHKPNALHLPAGRGAKLHKDLEEIVAYSKRELYRAFESEEYTHEKDRIVNELKKNQDSEFTRLQEYVEKYKFTVVRTPFGILLAPTIDGKPIQPADLESLSQEQRTKLEQLQGKLSEEVEKSLSRAREMARIAAEQLDDLNKRTALFLVKPAFDSLRTKNEDIREVVEHLNSVQDDIVSNASRFHPGNSSETASGPDAELWIQRYSVNLFVDNSALNGAPVILESHPSYHNLIGRIEHEAIMGATRTDFSMIHPGALHRANGGYLMLPARDLLINPYAWEGLKRVLKDGVIRVSELGTELGLLSTVTLEPDPIPLDLKVILVGTPLLYYLLYALDEDFAKLFKVRAEFATLMERTPQTEQEYGLFVKSVVDDNQLLPFANTAVSRLVEHSSRLAEDQEKLSTRFGKIADLIRESSYWAKKENKTIVQAEDVGQAINESIYRSNLVEERIQEMTAIDMLMVDVTGSKVGQINALSVVSLGDYSFGRPTRLTAAVYPGRAGVIDIERQAKLGGPIHTKGVLIISGYLGNRYGHSQPLNLTASLTFEQSYDEVEGDSASAAELISLLSAIANVPLRQELAITGSVNQHGQIQAIGGVNEKIEGFFDLCKRKGLTGEQGVMIPKSNQRNLMLRHDVIEAVNQGKFHIWSISTIDEGLALFTGLEPGQILPNGTYPSGSLNAILMDRLAKFSKVIRDSTKEEKPESDQENPQRGNPSANT